MAESRRTYTTRIKPSLFKALAHHAIDQDKDACELIEEALRLYLSQLEQKEAASTLSVSSQ